MTILPTLPATFKKIVDAGTYQLEPDYLSIFNGENENNQEQFFECSLKVEMPLHGMLPDFMHL